MSAERGINLARDPIGHLRVATGVGCPPATWRSLRDALPHQRVHPEEVIDADLATADPRAERR
jgi:hypothetical protein